MKNDKDFNYFEAFIDASNLSLKAAEMLNTTLSSFNKNEIDEKVKEIHSIEHSADLGRHEVMNRLVKEFLPPIEREDIISISNKIDDVVDAIDDVLIGIMIYNVETIRPEIHKFTELIVSCCKSMSSALTEFSSFKRSKTLQPAIIEVNRLEEVGDKLHIEGMHNLYVGEKDAVAIGVWKDIYNFLEKCCDECEHVADAVEEIVMKNS
jgi:predicted phosphate transport protein (TIGR00153 family)